MSYIDEVNRKRQVASLSRQSQASRDTLLRQLQSIEQATSSQKQTPMTARQQKLFDTVKEILETDEQRLMIENHTEVIKALAELKEALAGSEQATKSLSKDLTESLESVISAVRDLDMSPVINTPAPVVKITEKDIDFKPLQATIREAMQQRPEIVIPETAPVTDWTDLSRYRAQDLTEGSDKQYVGFMNPEGHWYIIENRISENAMRYVFGHDGYKKHFRNASSYEYKLLSEAMNDAS